MRVIEVSMEQRRNERAGETGDPRKNPPTCENPVTRPEFEPGSPWWDVSGLTARPPRLQGNPGATPAGDPTRFAIVGGECSNHYTTTAPLNKRGSSTHADNFCLRTAEDCKFCDTVLADVMVEGRNTTVACTDPRPLHSLPQFTEIGWSRIHGTHSSLSSIPDVFGMRSRDLGDKESYLVDRVFIQPLCHNSGAVVPCIVLL
ncbi:hypothetical protein PR048_003434 [Dryococelus australis]|uniref:Uncharacterized protein n=1 Tax=Dryococelus australis TaxID=614101 RepID=A0ABQ9IPE9_9NEOP|nr:hypothetical protein PR048_003434 [Dryococelus australis]